jgi:type II secretion system protein G
MNKFQAVAQRLGFTLIELLIVVAIIAILAAIAVPNFLEAQTRSKVSRVMADQRSVATAMEAYRVDNNKYPPIDNPDATRIVPVVKRYVPLSTPISYITGAPTDPFWNGRTDMATWGAPVFDFWTYTTPVKYGPRGGAYWWLSSYGPAKKKVSGGGFTGPDGVSYPFTIPYDPTNGTLSLGEIILLSTGFQKKVG